MGNTQNARTRYPLSALLAVGGAGLLFFFNMTAGFLLMALVPPLIPVYLSVLLGCCCLLGQALTYAQRVSIRGAAGMLRAGQHEGKVARRPLSARAA